MGKIAPVHSARPEKHFLTQSVFHDDDVCRRLELIEKENLSPGTDDRVKCDYCMCLSG